MGIQIYNHNKALELLQNTAGGLAYREFVEFLHLIPLIKFAGKSSKTKGLEFLQTCMNHFLNDVLKFHYGWHTQVEMPGGCGENNVDFYKKWCNFRVWMEAEFGNVARLDSDIRKLRSAFERNLSDVGIIIVPTRLLAKKLDRNVAAFERAITLLNSEKCNSFPVLLVGLELDANKVIDVSDWDYPLKKLKGSSHLPVKSHLAARIWDEHILPSLPSDSMHARHLETTQMLGFNPGLQKPVFKDYIAEVVATPEIFTLNEDGTLVTFEQPQKESKKKTVKTLKTTSTKKTCKPTAKPAASVLPAQPQLELALAVPSTPINTPDTVSSEPTLRPVLSLAVPSETNPYDAKLRAAISVQLSAPSQAQPPAEPQLAPSPEARRLSAAPVIVTPAPPARPVQPSPSGPRLGPWLSRLGAAASPFVTSFA